MADKDKPEPLTYEQAVNILNPAWQTCPYCHRFHVKGSEC